MVSIPAIWGCIPIPERECAIQLADASASMAPYVLTEAITAVFEAAAPGWAEVRQSAWENNWNVQKQDIEIDEETLSVYLANRPWMSEVYTCRLTGGCLLADPRCQQYAFINSP